MLADQQFLNQLREGVDTAILSLVTQYYAPINRYLYRLTGDPHTADDLTQETFLDAYVALSRLAANSNISAWLYQIATNRARKHRRRARLIRWLPLDLGMCHDTEDEARVIARDSVGQAMAQLSTEQREILLLYTWAGLNCAEIGSVIGKREDAVKMALMRARRRFRQAYESLEDQHGEESRP